MTRKSARRPPRTRKSPPAKQPVIVGIGASAGGIAAIGTFLEHVPSDSGLGLVVILHLDPKQESHVAQVLAPHTRIGVVQVEDGMPVLANRVHVILPGFSLTIRDGILRLGELPAERTVRRPVDVFFESLAADQKEKAVGVVLSGTGANGTAGLLAIKAGGGMTIAQDPGAAEFAGMPRSAIGAHAVDYVMAAEAMPAAILRYAQHPYVTAADRAETLEEQEARRLSEVEALLHVRTSHDFRGYRKATMIRRIHRRMGLGHIYHLKDYVTLLRENRDELDLLLRDLLINVTRFFRDPAAWDALRDEVVVPLMKKVDNHASIRAWVPGCATGEEAYSLAMLLVEEAEACDKRVEIKIFATDAIPDVLSVARNGIYPASLVNDLSPERVKRFFARNEDTYQVRQDLRELMVFAPQNLLQDPPFSKMDIVSCRNLLIYLEPDTQERVAALFHFALRPGGHLFLGAAETMPGDVLFEPVSRKARIYRRLESSRAELFDFPLATGRRKPATGDLPTPATRRLSGPGETTRKALLDQYAPAAVLIDQQGRVLYFYGRTDIYLDQPGGEPAVNIVALAREGLRAKLKAGIDDAIKKNRPVTLKDVPIRRDGVSARVVVEVTPLKSTDDRQQLLVSFRESPPRPSGERKGGKMSPIAQRDLRETLKNTRGELRGVVEELEAANEELRASNEEVVSMNEELQSSNEELETSKEELQSLNEELSTVNAQLQGKIGELEAATNDLSNLLAHTDVPILFLDTNLRIRTFTPAMTRLLELLPADIGRSIEHFAQKFKGAGIAEDARVVLEKLAPIENEVETPEGRWYVRRTVPYRTGDDRIEGVVVTFVDISAVISDLAARGRFPQLQGPSPYLEARAAAMLALLQDIAESANQAKTADEVLGFALKRIAEDQGWAAGHAFVERFPGSELVPSGVWFVREDLKLGAFQAKRMQRRYRPGEGLIGKTLQNGKPAVVNDLQHDPRLQGREDYQELPLHSAILIPIRSPDIAGAVLEFYSDHPIRAEGALLKLLKNVASQLGRPLGRYEIERRILEAPDKEQREIGQELHDRLGQAVSALAMVGRSIQRKLEDKSIPEAADVGALVSDIEDAKRQIRLLSRGLIPRDVGPEGLPAALSDLTVRLATIYGVDCRFEGEQTVTVEDDLSATQLFRIAQEALRNAAEHAEPTRILVSLRQQNGQVTLEVHDNGKGMPDASRDAPGAGLRIMRYRANLIGATFSVESRPGEGTTVRCVLSGGGNA